MAGVEALQREAAEVLEFFTGAEDGDRVMDGAGTVWHHVGGFWYAGSPRRIRKVSSVDLARALNPDLAVHMTAGAS